MSEQFYLAITHHQKFKLLFFGLFVEGTLLSGNPWPRLIRSNCKIVRAEVLSFLPI